MNKIKNKIAIIFISFMFCISISTMSNGAIEIKSGTTAYTSINISEAFDECYNLRDSSSTLGTNSLDPHMATSLDWGAVAYLAQSRYGRNGPNLTDITVNTTGNNSGVMNMNSYTFTVTMYENRNTTSSSATNYRYRLEEAIADPNMSKYVDLIPRASSITAENTAGRAIVETRNWYGAPYNINTNADNPIIVRETLFGINLGVTVPSGQAHSSISFRPIIWN